MSITPTPNNAEPLPCHVDKTPVEPGVYVNRLGSETPMEIVVLEYIEHKDQVRTLEPTGPGSRETRAAYRTATLFRGGIFARLPDPVDDADIPALGEYRPRGGGRTVEILAYDGENDKVLVLPHGGLRGWYEADHFRDLPNRPAYFEPTPKH